MILKLLDNAGNHENNIQKSATEIARAADVMSGCDNITLLVLNGVLKIK